MPACSSANVLRTEGLDCPDSVKERELAPIPIKERERTICPDSHREQGSRMTLRAELVGSVMIYDSRPGWIGSIICMTLQQFCVKVIYLYMLWLKH